MVETLTFLIMVFFTLQTHSMVPTCYLQRMPLDIQNHIASFLIEFESKKRFIDRTNQQKSIDKNNTTPYEQYIPKHDLHDLRLSHIGSAFNNNQTKSVLLSEWAKGSWPEKIKLTIVDLAKNNQIIFHNSFNYCRGIPQALALSEKGRIVGFGTNNNEKCACANNQTNYDPCQSILTLIYCDQSNIQNTRSFFINGHISYCAFNKQGTRIIIHGQNLSSAQEPNPSPYLLISFKQKNSTQQKKTKANQSNLSRYFKKKLINKNLGLPI